MKRRKEHLALGASTFSVKVQQNLNKNEDTQNKAAKRETVMMATMEMLLMAAMHVRMLVAPMTTVVMMMALVTRVAITKTVMMAWVMPMAMT